MFLPRKKQKTLHQSIKDAEDIYNPSSSNENLSLKDGKDAAEVKTMYEVFFLGIVPDIVMSTSHTRDKEAQLVDRIEEAQIDGKLPMNAGDDVKAKVKVNISQYGVKVIDMKGQEVLQRHPLHTLAQVVQYSDGADVSYVAFKIGNVNKAVFSAYLFQCMSEEQAQMICQNVKTMFDYVTEMHR